jgi:hypothetical protein
MMDTSKLVVGQDVDMVSGCYWNHGKVVKSHPEGVDVQAMYGVILHFDNEGKGRPDGNSTFECGLWYIEGAQPYPIDDVPITYHFGPIGPPRSK